MDSWSKTGTWKWCSKTIGNRNIDVKYENLYNDVDKRQLLISENYKTDKINTTKGKININENDELGLWRLKLQ